MRIKDLFTVPCGEKVTEKVLRRVLLSSVCSILICMICLVSTTWAWFTVSIVNTDNVIEIATVSANMEVRTKDALVSAHNDGCYELSSGDYEIAISLDQNISETDAFGTRKHLAYVVVSTICGDEVKSYYVKFEDFTTKVTVPIEVIGDSAKMSYCVSWVLPDAADPFGSDTVLVGEGAD